jgi:hypothetical protein
VVAAYEQLSLKPAAHITSNPESWWMVVRGPDVSLRVLFLLHEGRWAEALKWVALPNVCKAEVLMALAQALPTSQSDEALGLLDRAMRSDLDSAPPRTEWALVRVAAALRCLDAADEQEARASPQSAAPPSTPINTPNPKQGAKKLALLQRLQGEFHQTRAEFVAGLARL